MSTIDIQGALVRAINYRQQLDNLYTILQIPESNQDEFHNSFQQWQQSTVMDIFDALQLCKARASRNLSMPWETNKNE